MQTDSRPKIFFAADRYWDIGQLRLIVAGNFAWWCGTLEGHLMKLICKSSNKNGMTIDTKRGEVRGEFNPEDNAAYRQFLVSLYHAVRKLGYPNSTAVRDFASAIACNDHLWAANGRWAGKAIALEYDLD